MKIFFWGNINSALNGKTHGGGQLDNFYPVKKDVFIEKKLHLQAIYKRSAGKCNRA